MSYATTILGRGYGASGDPIADALQRHHDEQYPPTAEELRHRLELAQLQQMRDRSNFAMAVSAVLGTALVGGVWYEYGGGREWWKKQ